MVASEELSILSARRLRNQFSKHVAAGHLAGSGNLSELSDLAFDTSRRSDGSLRLLAYVLANVLSAISATLDSRLVTQSEAAGVESKITDPVSRSINLLCEGVDTFEAVSLASELINIQIDLS